MVRSTDSTRIVHSFIYYNLFSPKKLRGPERGAEWGPEGGFNTRDKVNTVVLNEILNFSKSEPDRELA